MLKLIVAIFLLSGALLAKSLTFGVIPYKSKDELYKIYTPLINYLSKKSGYKIRLHISSDYNDMLKLIDTNRVDFAIIGSFLYVQSKEKIPDSKYLLTGIRDTNGVDSWFYRSYIITLNESKINTINELKNRSFAFTDRSSTSGFLYPVKILNDNNIDYNKDFSKVFFLKKHNRVIEALLNNSIDAGATFDEIVEKAMVKNPNKIKILAKSSPIPYDTFVASEALSKSDYDMIKKYMLEYKDDKINTTVAGFIDLDMKYYEEVSKVAKQEIK